jgi:hypothetical protein
MDPYSGPEVGLWGVLNGAKIVAVDDIVIDSPPELCVKRLCAIHGGGNGQTESSDEIRVASRSLGRRRSGLQRRALFRATRWRQTASLTYSDAMGRRTRRYPVRSRLVQINAGNREKVMAEV